MLARYVHYSIAWYCIVWSSIVWYFNSSCHLICFQGNSPVISSTSTQSSQQEVTRWVIQNLLIYNVIVIIIIIIGCRRPHWHKKTFRSLTPRSLISQYQRILTLHCNLCHRHTPHPQSHRPKPPLILLLPRLHQSLAMNQLTADSNLKCHATPGPVNRQTMLFDPLASMHPGSTTEPWCKLNTHQRYVRRLVSSPLLLHHARSNPHFNRLVVTA